MGLSEAGPCRPRVGGVVSPVLFAVPWKVRQRDPQIVKNTKLTYSKNFKNKLLNLKILLLDKL